MDYILYIVGYLVMINIASFIIMGMDKKRAENGTWRISENTIWIVSMVGGTVGSILGMKQFRHKTKKLRFKLGLPLLFLVQILLVVAWL